MNVGAAERAPSLEDPTYASSQFIALAAGIIVGRCGCSSPASSLAPSSLSTIGREWVVFPARVVVVGLLCPENNQRKYVKIVVSPTLGLVGDPTILSFGGTKVGRFCGWLGPRSLTGERLVLTIDSEFKDLAVIDTSRSTVWDYVKHILILPISMLGTWNSNRRWLAVTENGSQTTLSLWNFERGIATGIEGVVLPRRVARTALWGDSSLVVSQQEGGVLVIDLEATLAHKRLVGTPLTFSVLSGNTLIDHIVSWQGVDYALLSVNAVLCLGNGQVMPWRWCGENGGIAHTIGGPYAAKWISSGEGLTLVVYSVLEPTTMCCVHRAQMGRERVYCGHEMVLLEEVVDQGPSTIKVIDAVSGFLVCKMIVQGGAVTEAWTWSPNAAMAFSLALRTRPPPVPLALPSLEGHRLFDFGEPSEEKFDENGVWDALATGYVTPLLTKNWRTKTNKPFMSHTPTPMDPKAPRHDQPKGPVPDTAAAAKPSHGGGDQPGSPGNKGAVGAHEHDRGHGHGRMHGHGHGHGHWHREERAEMMGQQHGEGRGRGHLVVLLLLVVVVIVWVRVGGGRGRGERGDEGEAYTCPNGRGLKITEHFQAKLFGWCLLSFRIVPKKESDVQHFLSGFLQVWLADQGYNRKTCTGWRWTDINVKHVMVSGDGYIKGIGRDHESIGEDEVLEQMCSTGNYRRLDRPLVHRVKGLDSGLLINLKGLRGHGGVSMLTLHDQRLAKIHQLSHPASLVPPYDPSSCTTTSTSFPGFITLESTLPSLSSSSPTTPAPSTSLPSSTVPPLTSASTPAPSVITTSGPLSESQGHTTVDEQHRSTPSAKSTTTSQTPVTTSAAKPTTTSKTPVPTSVPSSAPKQAPTTTAPSNSHTHT
ncbi:hypothetical protein Pelo_9326 [Pelomyxa schiedti]|nr:hypothetical protein Pelo_9326 [Pelomyxa schiedti]